MKKAVFLLFVAAVLCVLFAACSSTPKLTGTWSAETPVIGSVSITTTYVFNANGTGTVSTVGGVSNDFTYTADGGKITLKSSILGITNTSEGVYTIDGDTMTLTLDGVSLTLKRIN